MRDTRRLAERFERGDLVEVNVSVAEGREWQPARVLEHDPPGVWVLSATGQRWWVTNGSRIRHQEPAGE